MDPRLVIGWLFVCLGVLLAAYGLLSNPAIYQQSMGININLGWGVGATLFGGAMLAVSYRGRPR